MAWRARVLSTVASSLHHARATDGTHEVARRGRGGHACRGGTWLQSRWTELSWKLEVRHRMDERRDETSGRRAWRAQLLRRERRKDLRMGSVRWRRRGRAMTRTSLVSWTRFFPANISCFVFLHRASALHRAHLCQESVSIPVLYTTPSHIGRAQVMDASSTGSHASSCVCSHLPFALPATAHASVHRRIVRRVDAMRTTAIASREKKLSFRPASPSLHHTYTHTHTHTHTLPIDSLAHTPSLRPPPGGV